MTLHISNTSSIKVSEINERSADVTAVDYISLKANGSLVVKEVVEGTTLNLSDDAVLTATEFTEVS